MYIKTTTLLVLGCWGLPAWGQQAISTSGAQASGTGGTVSYTVGQTDYRQLVGNGFILTEGVQQPFELFVTGSEEIEIASGIRIFPNPTYGAVQALSEGRPFGYRLYDAQGRMLGQDLNYNLQHIILLQDYPTGTYQLETIIPGTRGLTAILIKK